MKKIFPEQLEKGRITNGHFASHRGELFGAFVIMGPCDMPLQIIACDASGDEKDRKLTDGWEHVSVSGRRIPNWEEMCFVKNLFFDEEETVVQFHPAKSAYINCHPSCLHLWGRPDGEIKLPPSILVGPQS